MHWLADMLLLAHACIVLFVVAGAAYIWLGARRDWSGTRSPLFRYIHLGVMLFVAAESILGIVCPLTRWENALRGDPAHAGFIARWVGRLIYYDLPAWVFTAAYLAFAAALIVTWFKVPPHNRHEPASNSRQDRSG